VQSYKNETAVPKLLFWEDAKVKQQSRDLQERKGSGVKYFSPPEILYIALLGFVEKTTKVLTYSTVEISAGVTFHISSPNPCCISISVSTPSLAFYTFL